MNLDDLLCLAITLAFFALFDWIVKLVQAGGAEGGR
jgi:hypothetical protein